MDPAAFERRPVVDVKDFKLRPRKNARCVFSRLGNGSASSDKIGSRHRVLNLECLFEQRLWSGLSATPGLAQRHDALEQHPCMTAVDAAEQVNLVEHQEIQAFGQPFGCLWMR